MSVLDQLRALEREVQQRLRELRPLVAEYRDLEKVAERLGLKRDADEPAQTPAAEARAARQGQGEARASSGAQARGGEANALRSAPRRRKPPSPRPRPSAKPAAASGRAAKRKPARRRTAAAPGQREQDVLRLVRERPGITVAELAGELSVDATGLYGVVRRLQRKGQISKDGTRLQPMAEPTPSTDRSTTPPAEASLGHARALHRIGSRQSADAGDRVLTATGARRAPAQRDRLGCGANSATPESWTALARGPNARQRHSTATSTLTARMLRWPRPQTRAAQSVENPRGCRVSRVWADAGGVGRRGFRDARRREGRGQRRSHSPAEVLGRVRALGGFGGPGRSVRSLRRRVGVCGASRDCGWR